MNKTPLLTTLLLVITTACAQNPAKQDNATDQDYALLEKYHWQLSEATDKQQRPISALFVQADKPVQLDVKDRQLIISNTCNNMFGTLNIKGNTLTVGKMASTMRLCGNDKIDALDSEVSKRLSKPAKFVMTRSEPPQLLLTTAQGDRLKFKAVPTDAMRFGSEGEQAFLEVAAKEKPCKTPGQPKASCLQVREVFYDENGLKAGKPGKWQTMRHDKIEGFTHEKGTHNVVRVKRYKVEKPNTKRSDVIYVLDMVVESGVKN